MKGNPARRLATFAAGATLVFLLTASQAAPVKVTEENIVIPTYLAGDPDPNPMFDLGRNSQGARGIVYPYPLYDTLTNIKSNKTYRIVYLENEYIRIGVLPEIGGRLFEGVDKSNGYNFIYRQHVIKPALIGLIGAWISGGIEWNIPHHHRATTFLPVQYRVEENRDGSKTIWVGELEIRHRMRWAVGYTLHPGKSYLECSVRILNRTPLVNTMLCFANVAVHVNENYQVIYPPSTRFVTFHGKHEFTTWPIATTRYAGADFTRGVDVSWYSNHISANSMFAWNYQDDFFAGYDHGREAGIMSFADHHIIPGKKFWTWGNGPRGRMWDKILTDTDGPYIELMVGAYSDNQPDYSWLQPFETKSFEMYWYPFRDIGGVKKANLEAAVNLDINSNGIARVGFCTTAPHRNAEAVLMAGNQVLFAEKIAIDPTKPFLKAVQVPAGTDPHELRASLSSDGKELVDYSPIRLEPTAMPAPVKGPSPPDQMKSNEELYLAGQRFEQFHSPNGDPEAYWDEALRRDPGDARVNTSLGIRAFKRARFVESEQHLRKAIERLTANYTAPKDGEPFYYLGLALKAQNKLDAAYDAFYKATWSEAWRSPAYFSLAEIATQRGELPRALDFASRSVQGNELNIRALTLKAALLRHLGRAKEALALLDLTARFTDPLDVRIMAERWLLGDKRTGRELSTTVCAHPATALETAAEYADAGLWSDGTNFLTMVASAGPHPAQVSPLVYYYLGEFAENLGDHAAAADYRRLASQMPPDYVFPFQWEAMAALRRAIELNPQDARAPYYLGNALFDGQPNDAVTFWKRSAALDPSFAIVHRNLAVAYAHQQPNRDPAAAIQELELAVAAPIKYAAHFTELDELYAETGYPPEKRLALLERNHDIVSKRDDALSREIGLKVFAGKYDEAIHLMTGRKFSVWEGGKLEVVDHWVNAHLLRGRKELSVGQSAEALADFQAAKDIPENLPTEQEVGRSSELAYWQGRAFRAKGDAAKARECWLMAANVETSGRRRGGAGRLSAQQVQTYYEALAEIELEETKKADATLHDLLAMAENGIEHSDASQESGRTHSVQTAALAHYVAGLAHTGLGEISKARTEFRFALEAAPDFLGPKAELSCLPE